LHRYLVSMAVMSSTLMASAKVSSMVAKEHPVVQHHGAPRRRFAADVRRATGDDQRVDAPRSEQRVGI
jgi:hypothetical protein